MNDTLNKLLGASLAILLLSSSFIAAIPVSTGNASADIGEDGCKDDVLGLLTGGATVVLYDNYRDPCFASNDDIGDTTTDEEAKRLIASSALEDKRFMVRYFDEFDQNADRLDNPAYLDGKNAFIYALKHGETETEAVTDSHLAVHNRTAGQQRSLWLQYRSVMDSMSNLEATADARGVGESFRVGYYNSTSGSFEDSYSLRNYTDVGATVNVTLTTGEYVQVPAPYKTDGNGTVTDKLHPVTDNVLVTVYDPETGSHETIVNTVDFGTIYPTASLDNATAVKHFDEQFGTQPLVTSGVWSGEYAGEFDGSSAFESGTANTASITIAAAADPDDAEHADGDYHTFVAVDGTGEIMLRFSDTGEIEFGVNPGSNFQKITAPVPDNDLNHYAATYNGSTGEATLYINGAEAATGTLSTYSSTETFRVGQVNGKKHYVGTLDDVRAYETELSQTQIQELATRGSPNESASTYTNQYEAKHTKIEEIDNTVISALGDENSGYLNDVHTNVNLGEINLSDMYTPLDKYRLSVESSDIGEQSWLAYQYTQLGYSGSNISDSVEIKIHNGSIVDNSTLSENKTYSGQLFTAASPPNGTWVNGETYSVGAGSDINGTVYIQTTETVQKTVDGSITYEVVGRTVAVESGTITVQSITDENGTVISEADHTVRDPDYTTDTSKITQQINELQVTIEKLRAQIDEDGDGNAEDATSVTSSSGNFVLDLGPLGTVELPFGKVEVRYAAIGVAVIGGGMILTSTTSTVASILSMFGGKP